MTGRTARARLIVVVIGVTLFSGWQPSQASSAPRGGLPILRREAQRAGQGSVRAETRRPAASLQAPKPPTGPDPGGTPPAAATQGEAGPREVLTGTPELAGGGQRLSSLGFPGLDDRWRPGCAARPCQEPADSGVAVGDAHVLQVVEHRLAIYERPGTLLEQVQLADLFGPITDRAVGSYGESLPSVAWNATHRRWLVSQAAWDCRHGMLELAVSHSADPFAAWSLYSIDFGSELPTFPAMAASTDKVVITGDHVGIDPNAPSCLAAGHRGAGVTIIDWADLLALPASLRVGTSGPDPGLIAWRPAAGVTGGPAINLIGGLITGSSWHVAHARITGTLGGTGDAAIRFTDPADLTVLSGLEPFRRPPAPRVPGGQLDNAADARPLSAVIRGTDLWFLATAPCRPGGEPTVRSCTRAVEIGPDGRTILRDLRLGDVGWDTFAGGIGLSLDGAVSVVFARSAAQRTIRNHVAYRAATNPTGDLRAGPMLVPPGGDYAGERWGRVHRLAADPAHAAVVWQAGARPESGGWATWVSGLDASASVGPGGTVTLAGGRAYSAEFAVRLDLRPTAGSASVLARISNSPLLSGGLLTKAATVPLSGSLPWRLDDAATGGSTSRGNRAVYLQFGDGLGQWSRVASDSILIDTTPPTVSAPRPILGTPATLTPSLVPVDASWSRSDAGSGIRQTQLQLQSDGGVYGVLADTPALLGPGHTYRFRGRAQDGAGNWSGWLAGPSFALEAVQERSTFVSYLGTWSDYPNSDAFGGSTRYATRPGSRASLSFQGRAIGVVAATGPTRGLADVIIDGRLAGTIDLYSSDSRVRQLVYAAHWSGVGAHGISIVVKGTAGHPRVDLDAFVVLR
jgi:hypothetical protein